MNTRAINSPSQKVALIRVAPAKSPLNSKQKQQEIDENYVEQQLNYEEERREKMGTSSRMSLNSEQSTNSSSNNDSSSGPFVIGADDDAQQIYDPYGAVNKKLKKTFLDWCEVSTTHALSNLARARNKVVFSLWLLTFLACVAYCSYTIINIIISFLSYQVLVDLQVAHQTPVEFPAVTVRV